MTAAPEIVKVAAVQAAPVHMNLAASIEKAIGLAEQAATKGCDLIAFGEAWFPGYPFHIWLGPPAWSLQFTKTYFDNSLELGSPEFHRLMATARRLGIMMALGYSERSAGSLYLGQCLIDRDGELVFARRKLKPTHVERSVFGEGYGDDLTVVDTALGKIGALCCWEHLQPLSKYAMYAQGEAIHIAGWPAFSVYREQAFALGKEVNMAASQTYAVEGQCFVVAASSVIDQATLDIFENAGGAADLLSLGGGAAMIFGPDGKRLLDYLPETEEGLQIADLPMAAIVFAKAVADPAGHYAKPESTQLLHHRSDRRPVVGRMPDDADAAVNTSPVNQDVAS